MLPQNLCVFVLLVQSEAKIMIELLNICFIDNTDLVLWLTYCIKKKKFFSFMVQTPPTHTFESWRGGAVAPLAPPSTPVDCL